MRRVFLDWAQPALGQVAEYLAERFAGAGSLDLSGVLVAMPGARAGRRLLEVLVELAESRRLLLDPPRIVTVGQLPEKLYAPKKRFATPLVQQLAWSQAAQRCGPDCLRKILPSAALSHDLAASLALGETLGRLHRELAADGLDFAAVAAAGDSLPGFREADRWEALAEIQNHYLRVLDELDLWDMQTARLFAIRNAEFHTDSQIVLVGTVDLNRSQRLMLDQVADRVTSIVLADASLVDRFDEHGCLRPAPWQTAILPLDDCRIEVVGSPADQAAAVVRTMASYEGQYSAEDIVVAVPDESIVPYVEQRLTDFGLRCRYGAGQPLARSGPCRLLATVADYLESRQYAALAALVRHPAIYAWLSTKKLPIDWLSELDTFHGEHLPHHLDGNWPDASKSAGVIAAVYDSIEQLVAPLAGEKRPLGEWGKPVADMLLAVLDDRLNPAIEPDRTILAACTEIREVLKSQAAIPTELMPTTTAVEAIRLVLAELESATVAPPTDHEAIELLGWLELPLDDAPATIVTGLNEGIVPSSLNADLFLPNQLRRALGIEDNDRRYARDAYALAVLAHSRKCLTLIAGRRSVEGDPRSPSRLLFACDDQKLAPRVQRFFEASDSATVGGPSLGLLRPGREESAFEIPRPRPLERKVTSMRVTEFRDYLACPYRYYLRQRLGLSRLDDAAEELDGGGFGSLAHTVLERFGQSPTSASTDPQAIAGFLNAALEESLRQKFPTPRPAVLVQVEQLRARLAAFARWQAEWAAQGWRIEHVEAVVPDGKSAIVVDGEPMWLRGRIDRIDVHGATGRRIVLDYKTSDQAKSPEQTHRRQEQWTDLQLPLYRHLIATLGINEPVDLGYIVLPKDTSKVGLLRAEWTVEDLAEADRAAEAVIRGVRAEQFWPPADPPPDFSEDYSAICQDGRFAAVVAAEEQDAA